MRRRTAVGLLFGATLAACRREADASPRRLGPDVRVKAATEAAVQAADYRAATAGARLRLPVGRYRLGTLRLEAPAVAFDPGAVIVPEPDATVTFEGQIQAGTVRLFEVAERPPGAAPAITLSRQTVRPEWWGALAAGPPHEGHDDSLAWQQALDALAARGGTVLARAGATYPLRFPIVVTGGDVAIELAGARLLTDLARAGRAPGCVLLIGNSREWNLDKARERRIAGDLFNNFENPAFTDIGLIDGAIAAGHFPDAADPGRGGFTARRCSIAGGRIDYYDDVAQPGNYGVQFANAAECHAERLRMRNVGQGFGFGSDMTPRVPYAVGCRVADLVVERVNQAHTYYGAGFHGYARDCRDERVTVLAGAPDGSPDGNLWAANYAIDCTSTASGGVCGRGANGEGFSIGAHARRCTIRGARVVRARRAFVNFGPLDAAAADGSAVIDSSADDVDYLISLQSRNMRFERVRGRGVRVADVLADNVNATGNSLVACDAARVANGAVPLTQVRAANRIG